MMLKRRIHKWGHIKIETDHVFPAIPLRHLDWAAWEAGVEDGVCGNGKTEQEAIDSFKQAYIEEYL